jgi:hypothetical protein
MAKIESAIAATAKAWANIDQDAIRARFETFVKTRDELDSAIASADDKIHQIGRQIAQETSSGPDVEAAADAILHGVSILERVPSLQMLRDEQERLRKGRGELAARRNRLIEDLSGFQREIGGMLQAGAEPLIDALMEQLKTRLQQIDVLYAIARGFGGYVKSLSAPKYAALMYPMIEASMRVVDRKPAALPDEFLALLSKFEVLLEMQTRRFGPRR